MRAIKRYLKDLPGLFKVDNNRLKNVQKNFFLSIFIKVLSIASTLLLVPLTLNYLDPVKYGVWLTISSIVGWLGVFDIGLGNGLRNKLGESFARGDMESAKIYVSTTYFLLSMIVLLMLFVFFIIFPFCNWSDLINSPENLHRDVNLLVIAVFVTFALRFVFIYITTILYADQKAAKSNVLGLATNIASLAIVFVVGKIAGSSLLFMGMGLSIATLIVPLAATLWYFGRNYRAVSPSIRHVKLKYAKDVVGVGFVFFLIQVAGIVLLLSNNLIISKFLGPSYVTIFNIPYRYFSVILGIFALIVDPVWAAYTEAITKNEIKWVRDTQKKLYLMWAATAVVVVVMIAMSNFVFRIWIKNKVDVDISITALIGLYTLLYAWVTMNQTIPFSTSKVKFLCVLYFISAILNVGLCFVFVKMGGMGLPGVILANCVSLLPIVVLIPIQNKKIIERRDRGIWSA